MNMDNLALWSVDPLPPNCDDLLRGPFDSILSTVNISIADPRILLDLVVLPNDDGEAIVSEGHQGWHGASC